MFENKVRPWIKILVAITFLIMITANWLATSLPINGLTTAEVSSQFPNLFAPAGFTFAIWGLIYFALAGFTIYQFGFFQRPKTIRQIELLEKVGIYFSLSSLFNTAWIFAWHYLMIPLSMILMIAILLCLIKINNLINKENLSFSEKVFIRFPFSIYYGWITVATLANLTTLWVSLGGDGLGKTGVIWAITMIVIGTVIGLMTIVRNKNIAYGLVLIWAYVGILYKHKSATGFNGEYPEIIITVIVSLILFVIAEAYILFFGKKNKW
ncbi:hypothetical protein SAMN00017405_0776 [Desulfonispora thiosulfatigenes DSM 11270]|uniref:TspO and MBR related proteins n=1 Tax=Desulfonispora thiosulfatigenes DSM 11270 TaxID=656914 RepID=A0A1W1UER9_DESTI|nr:lantibiotic ABC transporter permease [Desulfonispora thiosulfatigenes]SMB79577.1 hypothetical protein SAMN00017405_0776 [Desulfonispora thiosulfatigenes DSM 11270]